MKVCFRCTQDVVPTAGGCGKAAALRGGDWASIGPGRGSRCDLGRYSVLKILR